MKIQVASKVERTRRVTEIESLFSLPAEERIRRQWEVNLPLEEKEWSIGLLVGPSGAGKTTIARRLWPLAETTAAHWTPGRPIVEEFPAAMKTREIAALLTNVGFSTIPSWLRPFETLSTGERFRVEMARSIAATAPGEELIIDEFTSTIDRQTAQIASAATARAARRKGIKLVALTCHYDVIKWLDPDWIYQPHTNKFKWRDRRGRPEIKLTVYRATNHAWEFFRHHHYLTSQQNAGSQKFVAVTNSRVAAYISIIYQPHPQRPGFREHRGVCLPDFQGVGIGTELSDYVAGIFAATGLPLRAVASHPAMIFHKAKSKKWKMTRPPSKVNVNQLEGWDRASAKDRQTASFEYVGPRNTEAAEFFGIIPERVE